MKAARFIRTKPAPAKQATPAPGDSKPTRLSDEQHDASAPYEPKPSRIDPLTVPKADIPGMRYSGGRNKSTTWIDGDAAVIIAAGYADPTWFYGRRGKKGQWLACRRFELNGRRTETRISEDGATCSIRIAPPDSELTAEYLAGREVFRREVAEMARRRGETAFVAAAERVKVTYHMLVRQ